MTAHSATLRSFSIILAVLAVSVAGTVLTASPAAAQGPEFGTWSVSPNVGLVGTLVTYTIQYRDDDDDAPTVNRVALYTSPTRTGTPVATINLATAAQANFPAYETWTGTGTAANAPHGLYYVNFEFTNQDGSNNQPGGTVDFNDPPVVGELNMDPRPYGRQDDRDPLQPEHGLCVASDNSTITLIAPVTDPDDDPIGTVEYQLWRNGALVVGWTPMIPDPDNPGRYLGPVNTSTLLAGPNRVYEWYVRATDAPIQNGPPTPRTSAARKASSSLNFWISTQEPSLRTVDQNNEPYNYPVVTPDDSYAGSIGAGSSSSTFEFRVRYWHPDGLYPRGLEANRVYADDIWLGRAGPEPPPDRDTWVQPVVILIEKEGGSFQEHFAFIDPTASDGTSTTFSSYPTSQWVNDSGNEGVVFRYIVEPRHANYNDYHPSETALETNWMRLARTSLPAPIMYLTGAWSTGSNFRNFFTAFADQDSYANRLLGAVNSASQPLTISDGHLRFYGRTTADYYPPAPRVERESTIRTFEVDGVLSQGGYSATLLDGTTPSWQPNNDNAPQVLDRSAPQALARDFWPYPNMNHTRTRSTDTYNFWVRSHEYTGAPPDYVAIYLDGARYLMKPSAGPGDSVAGGMWYQYTVSDLTPGVHNFRFESNNTQRTAYFPERHADTRLRTLRVNNRPQLSSGSVTPATGQEGTSYTYEVTYSDADGDKPHQAYCNIFDPAENNGDGLVNATTAAPYTITDSEASWTPGALVNRYVQITSSSVGPMTSAMGWYFRVTGNTSDTLTVVLPDRLGYNYTTSAAAFAAISAGDRYHVVRRAQMVPVQPASPVAADFQSGVVYRYVQNQLSNPLNVPKEYRYSFTFQDRWDEPISGLWHPYNEPGEFVSLPAGNGFGVSGSMSAGPTVEAANVAPELSEPAVDPVAATTNDIYRFEVTYTDANNDAPSAINLLTSSTANNTPGSEAFGTFSGPTPMAAVDPGDLVITDGKRYFVEINLPLGNTYAFTVNASDGTSNATYQLALDGFQEFGGQTGVFGPIVGPNTAPIIDDVNFAGTATSNSFYREEPTQAPEDVPAPPFGVLSDVTWYLEYRDVDGHAPEATYPRIYFDGVPYEMEKVNPADDDYAAAEDNFPPSDPDGVPEGVRYQFNNADLNPGVWALGTHTFFFLVSDGEDTVRLPAAGTYTVAVTNLPPMLSQPRVSPTFGRQTDSYTYQVTYTDLDDNPPAFVTLLTSTTANSLVPSFGTFLDARDMEEVDPGDTDYTDGKLYAFTAPAPPPGNRNAFTFIAGDGSDDATYADDFTQIGPAYGAFGPEVASLGVIAFTNAGGAPVATYEEGATVYVRVTDADENRDPATVETLDVVISDEGGDSETVTLTETGPNTAIFRGSIATLGRAGADENGTLNVISGPDGSQITATWDDPDEDVLGMPSAVDTAMVRDTVAPARLAAPQLLVSTGASGTSVDLDWSAYDEDAQVDVAGYHVWRHTADFASTAGRTPIATIPAGTQTYTAAGLTIGVEYWFAVSAFDEVPNEDQVVNARSETTADTAAPYLANRAPAPNATDVPVATDVSFDVLDAGVGVDLSTIRLWIDGIEVTSNITTSVVTNGFGVNYDPPVDFDWNATVQVRVVADDLEGNRLDTTYTFDTAVDVEAPQVTQRSFDAAAGTMGFHITDNRSGVDVSTIALSVDGVDVSADLAINAANPLDVIVAYQAPDGWGVNRTITFAADASDIAGNAMATDTWQRDAEIDNSGPVLDQFTPADGTTNAPIDTAISLRLRDSGAGVDRDSVVMTVNGEDVSAELTWDMMPAANGVDETVATYQPADDLDWETDHAVHVEAADTVGNTSTADWSFRTVVEPTFDIRGIVTDSSGDPLAGVAVTAGGQTVSTDGNGAYRISGLTAGDYTVTPTFAEHDFVPTSTDVTLGPDARDIDFVGTIRMYAISGRITRAGAGVEGVEVSDGTRTAISDADGNYIITNVPNGVYTVRPTRDQDGDGFQDFTYTPQTRTANVASADVTGANFTATPVTYTISGTIRDAAGNRVAGVTVSDGTRTAVTNEAGQYTISGITASTVTLTPTRAGIAFDPVSRELTVPPAATGADFVAFTEFQQRFTAGLQMVAVPADPPAGRDRAVDVFQTPVVARWDAAANPQAYVFGQQTPDAPQLQVVPGRAFFVNFPATTDVLVPGDPVADNGTFSVGVSTGWNMLGNPWEAALPMANIAGAGSTQVRPYAFIWDASVGSYRLVTPTAAFNSARTYIEAWEGAWFKATGAAGTLTLAAPSGSSAAMLDGADADVAAPDNGWLVDIVARVAGRADLTTVAGVGSGNAAHGYRVENPPMLPRSVDVYFTGDAGQRLAHDIRPQSSGPMVWPFAVETDIANAEVEVTLPDLSAVPADLAVYLTDVDSGRRMYARTLPAYTFTSGADGALRHFELEIAPRGADNLAIRSAAVQAAGGGVMVTYDLSSAASVSIEVLNIAGRQVRTLLQSRAVPAGGNEQMWDMRSADGTLVPNGSYLVKIEAVAENGQRVQALRPAQIAR